MNGSRFHNPHWSIYHPSVRYPAARGDEARTLRAVIAHNREVGRKNRMIFNQSALTDRDWAL